MLHILHMLEILHMVVDIVHIVHTVQMVRTVHMELHSMFDSQLKIKYTTHLKQLNILKLLVQLMTDSLDFLFGLILIIVGRSIELRLVVLVRCCVLTITSLMLLLWKRN